VNPACIAAIPNKRFSFIFIFIFIQFGDNIQTARQLHDAVFAKFRDKSQLLLINYVCYLCVTLSSIFNDYVILLFSSA